MSEKLFTDEEGFSHYFVDHATSEVRHIMGEGDRSFSADVFRESADKHAAIKVVRLLGNILDVDLLVARRVES